MTAAARFIIENGQRKLQMGCPLCKHFLDGPLSRYLMDVRGKQLEMICGACRQPFTIEASEVKYAPEV